MSTIHEIIRRPIISEKSTALAEVAGRYVFEVLPSANKPQIRDAIQRLFGVKVTEVRTLTVPGDWKKTKKSAVKLPNWKKAIVTLGKGQKIDFFQTK